MSKKLARIASLLDISTLVRSSQAHFTESGGNGRGTFGRSMSNCLRITLRSRRKRHFCQLICQTWPNSSVTLRCRVSTVKLKGETGERSYTPYAERCKWKYEQDSSNDYSTTSDCSISDVEEKAPVDVIIEAHKERVGFSRAYLRNFRKPNLHTRICNKSTNAYQSFSKATVRHQEVCGCCKPLSLGFAQPLVTQ